MELCYSYDVWFRNDTYDEYHALLASVQSYLASLVSGWAADDRAPASYSCSPSIQINDGELYDGHIAIRATWEPGSAGMTGDTDGIEEWVTYAGNYNAGASAIGRGKKSLHDFLCSTGSSSKALVHKASFGWNHASNTWSATIDLQSHAYSDELDGVHLNVNVPGGQLNPATGVPAVQSAGKPVLVQ